VVGQEWVEKHGGEVRLMPLVGGKSTTGIIDEVLARYQGSPGTRSA
jgi:bifunctional ADP-heptose synthase (sugar kinase/adenylyltransferase)